MRFVQDMSVDWELNECANVLVLLFKNYSTKITAKIIRIAKDKMSIHTEFYGSVFDVCIFDFTWMY